jgi:uncharacterized protein (DUF1684 family)
MRMAISRALTLGVAIAALLVTGCRPAYDGSMVSIPPPAAWERWLEQGRALRDEDFRTSSSSPLLAEDRESFDGLDYWAPDSRYYFAGDLHRYAEPQRFTMMTTAGKERPCERYGWIRFRLGGTPYTLQVYRLLDQRVTGTEALFLPFRDATSGSETYPAGRYVDLQGAFGGPYVLDFNTAYNPSCAYGDPQRFACPSTPRENHLPVRIEAGELGFKRQEGSGPPEIAG